MITKRSIRIPVLAQPHDPPYVEWLIVLLLFAFVAVAGCASLPSTGAAFDVANKALVGVDLAADVAVEALKVAREAKVEECRAKGLETEEERVECMGKLGAPLRVLAEQVAEAYDDTLFALEELKKAVDKIEELK